MRSIVVFAAIVVAAATHSARAEPLLIPADKIYTAPDAAPLLNGSVLVQGGRIRAVADERSRIAIPEGTRTSECRGVVVAGFQNSHVHFTELAWRDAAHAPVKILNDRLEAMLTKYGYTTVFDTGSDLGNTVALRKRIGKGDVRGPRILTAGLPLYPPEGIPHYINNLPPELLARMHQPRNAAEARQDVRQNVAAGADGTKLFLVTSPGHDVIKVMSLDVARAAAEQSHRRGKLVLAHPTSIDGIRIALDAGVDILVHTTLGEKLPWDDALVKRMVAQNMAVMPTFKLWGYELQKGKVPPEVIERLVASTRAELLTFLRAGGQVLFGTDVGYMLQYDPTEEYQLMSQAGLTPMEILASLTTAPAARWKESARRGRVAPGLDADLVVLAADPAEDVRNFANVRCAFRGGVQIYPDPIAPAQAN
jgi:imidazolonepropionase-like amidohydrolase